MGEGPIYEEREMKRYIKRTNISEWEQYCERAWSDKWREREREYVCITVYVRWGEKIWEGREFGRGWINTSVDRLTKLRHHKGTKHKK